MKEKVKDLYQSIIYHLSSSHINFVPTLDVSIRSNTESQVSNSYEIIKNAARSCSKCRLCETRNNVVFGSGKIVRPVIAFVGEAPGAEEDASGLPFVGRAGELLTAAITKGLKLSREDVYICNAVKCRPPENRTPQPDELQACASYLFEQLRLIQPHVIVCLGGTAIRALTGREDRVLTLRGNWLTWEGIPVMPTVHPVYVLRKPDAKKDFWEDLKKVMQHLRMC